MFWEKALEFEVKTQVEKESKIVGLENEDALNRARWRVGAGEIAVRVG